MGSFYSGRVLCILASSSSFSVMTLLIRLRDYRLTRSAVESVPIYCVLGDAVMGGIAQSRPTTMKSLMAVRGITPEQCGQYGGDILTLVLGSPPDPPPPPPARVVMRHGGTHSQQARYRRRMGSGKRELLNTIPLNTAMSTRMPRTLASRGTWGQANPALLNVPMRGPAVEDTIYVLELGKGRVYVGRTSDCRKRFTQHMSGKGSAFTQAFLPTGNYLPRLGRVTGSAEAAERDETLRYMHLRGINLVRGWKYTRVVMRGEELREAEENIRELFDLCRRCGCPGHFVTQCRAVSDRLGHPIP